VIAVAGPVHRAVLVEELLEAVERGLGPDPRGRAVDATVGAGGHGAALLERFPGLELLGLDWDPDSLAEAERTLRPFAQRVQLDRSPLAELEAALARHPGPAPVLWLADLGVCSLHFDRPERGFSLHQDGPLDMRMDPAATTTAAEIVNHWPEERLADLFFQEGGERRSRRAAAAIVGARRRVPFARTAALAELLERELGPGGPTHPATRVFQALRRAVNAEGEQLERGLGAAERCLAPGGLLAVISFHSGEDGAVKRAFAASRRAGSLELLDQRPLGPGAAERRSNRRARSARLRVARRTDRPIAEAQR
jgi:16S rRNA (cytosine1402-N4)-methyltransferase